MGAEGGRLIPFPDPDRETVSGELVDADGDGQPDTEHTTDLIERPDDDLVHVGEPLEGELLDEADERQLAWQRVMETRPVLPNWVREREQRIEAVRWATRYTWHRAKFHAVRSPLYGGRLVGRVPRGLARCLSWWGRWAFDLQAAPLRHAAVLQGDAATYTQLQRMRDDRVKRRVIGSLIAAGITSGGLVAMDALWPTGWWLLIPGAVAAFGALGGRQDRPLLTQATVTQQASKLKADVVSRAFVAAKLADEKQPITFPQPIQRDGKGWLAVVDLPYGKTFRKHAATKRADIASGLDVNVVTVFLDPDPMSERRVRLWVSDVDVFAQKPVPSPLIKAAKWDLWQGVPFGVDARDRLITMPLVWSNLLVGAIPRMGKTFAARIPVAAAALDPHTRLYVFNGKGDRAWQPFEQVAHVYGSGVREEVVERLVNSLHELVADMNDRFERMSKLPADQCPEAKLTPALSRSRRLNMPLTVIAIDEVQRYLEHPKHGETILDLLTDLVKVGPAAGFILVLATQKPDSKVMPDSLRGQIGTRFAMKVMTWQASETILGAGTYPAGMDASQLLRKHKGVGILLGADDGDLAERGGTTVRSHLLADGALEDMCRRARQLREDEGLLTGMAAGQMPAAARPSRVLEDLLAVFEEDRIHSEVAVQRLAERDPEVYDGWTKNDLAGALKPDGVRPGQAWATGLDGKKKNAQGYARDNVVEALARRLDQ